MWAARKKRLRSSRGRRFAEFANGGNRKGGWVGTEARFHDDSQNYRAATRRRVRLEGRRSESAGRSAPLAKSSRLSRAPARSGTGVLDLASIRDYVRGCPVGRSGGERCP